MIGSGTISETGVIYFMIVGSVCCGSFSNDTSSMIGVCLLFNAFVAVYIFDWFF
jgi:hypothetical protein